MATKVPLKGGATRNRTSATLHIMVLAGTCSSEMRDMSLEKSERKLSKKVLYAPCNATSSSFPSLADANKDWQKSISPLFRAKKGTGLKILPGGKISCRLNFPQPPDSSCWNSYWVELAMSELSLQLSLTSTPQVHCKTMSLSRRSSVAASDLLSN